MYIRSSPEMGAIKFASEGGKEGDNLGLTRRLTLGAARSSVPESLSATSLTSASNSSDLFTSCARSFSRTNRNSSRHQAIAEVAHPQEGQIRSQRPTEIRPQPGNHLPAKQNPIVSSW
jgi:hypothetical protein